MLELKGNRISLFKILFNTLKEKYQIITQKHANSSFRTQISGDEAAHN